MRVLTLEEMMLVGGGTAYSPPTCGNGKAQKAQKAGKAQKAQKSKKPKNKGCR